jgi:hypothetical protein
MSVPARLRDTCIGSNLGGGMSSSGAHKLLWCIGHTFEFQACGSPATTAAVHANDHPDGKFLIPLVSTTYNHFFAAEKHGRGFAELGVVPQVRLERL